MLYRNDHDAALARIDSLESENARLQTELAKLRGPTRMEPEPEPPPFKRVQSYERGVVAMVIGMVLLGAFFLAVGAH